MPCIRLYPDSTITTDFRDLIENRRIDAVAIATPAHSHFELAMAALRAGKHVIVEKPLAQTSEPVCRLIDQAKRRKLTLMVDHTFVYTPAVQKFRQLISESRFGGDILLQWHPREPRTFPEGYQRDLGPRGARLIHIQYILNEAPVAVSATGATHFSGTPETWRTSPCSSRAVAWRISAYQRQPAFAHQGAATLHWRQPQYDRPSRRRADEKIKVYDKGITMDLSEQTAHPLRIGYRAGDMCAPHLAASEALRIEARHFIDCVRDGSTPMTSRETGLQVVEIPEAASRSIAAQGMRRLVPSPPTLRKRNSTMRSSASE
jgi:predicted dehydrogenase